VEVIMSVVRMPVRVVLFAVLLLAVSTSGLWAGPPALVVAHEKAPGLPAAAEDDDFLPRDPAKEELGRLLFFDKELSGNRNTSCATCHHPLTGTAEGLSLPVGEGGTGLGVTRNTGSEADAIHERVPRNAPHVFNLGALEFKTMFHDGRLAEDPGEPSGFRSPAGALLPAGLDSALAAQAMFPVTSTTEMAGQHLENPIGTAAAAGDVVAVWDLLALRLQAIDDYVDLFVAAFDDVSVAGDITYAHAANAIGAFEAAAYRSDDSPFDRYLRGDGDAMSPPAKRGMRLFYGRAGCDSCHAGTFQTDHLFHATGVPQIGPGKGDNLPGYSDGLDDFGRERVTGLAEDRFRFRTPSLRNVALTGPWGHDGAYNDLEAMVRHMLDPETALAGYDMSQALLPPRDDLDAIDFLCYTDPARRAAVEAVIEVKPVSLRDREVEDLVEFLHALTDPRALDIRNTVPMEVPSLLPVAE
jgi:cytochrome c peroxidase